jgi:hypothetical protein
LIEKSQIASSASHQRSQDEGHDRRHADERQRPRQRLQHLVRDRVREERQRDAEVTAGDVPEVREVRADQALVVVDAERDLERVQRLRVHVTLVPGHHRDRGVPRHEARDEEVQRDRRPERHDKEPKSSEDEPHLARLMPAEPTPSASGAGA